MEVRPGFRKARTYGKKTGGPSRDKSAIFASNTPTQKRPVAVAAPAATENVVIDSPKISAVPAPSAARQALTDVTNKFVKISLSDKKPEASAKGEENAKNIEQSTSRITRSGLSSGVGLRRADEKYKWLGPLRQVYVKDGRPELTLQKWQDVLQEGWNVEKFAESSYAEVFKVKNHRGTSILKLMALKPPTGRGSRRETAVTAESIASEVFIMDLMADIPGFIVFKEAWIIEGKPSQQIISAFEKFETAQKSEFDHPKKYPKDQIFLALELGDAGTDIEHFEITRISQIWDVLLKVVAALATGENECGFEHRDLHEGNVCVKQTGRPKDFDSNQRHKFGYSGLDVTLLDYTLSRANDKLNFVAFRDLEQDHALFSSNNNSLQSQIYRRMRAYNCFGTRTFGDPVGSGKGKAPMKGWQAYNPYTNVLWIYYILDFLIKNYKGTESIEGFMRETQEFRRKLDPDIDPFSSAFKSACDVLEFCDEEDWIFPAEYLNPMVDTGLDEAEAARDEYEEAVSLNSASETSRGENEEAGSRNPAVEASDEEDVVWIESVPSDPSSSSSSSDALYMRAS